MKKETLSCFLFLMVDTLRVGSGAAGHLIHRGAVPLPLKGKDNAPLKLRRSPRSGALLAIADLIHRKRSPFPS